LDIEVVELQVAQLFVNPQSRHLFVLYVFHKVIQE